MARFLSIASFMLLFIATLVSALEEDKHKGVWRKDAKEHCAKGAGAS